MVNTCSHMLTAGISTSQGTFFEVYKIHILYYHTVGIGLAYNIIKDF